MNKLFYGDNLDVLRKFIRDETVDLCYIDPPFNSKRNYNQIYNNIGQEDRAQAQAFTDTWEWNDHANECFDEILSNKNQVQSAQSIALINGLEKVLGKGALFAYLVSMTVRIAEIHRALKPTGSFYLHCDPTASHYLKLACDALFVTRGGDFRNEIVWKRSTGHNLATKRFDSITDTILFYTKSNNYIYNRVYTPVTKEELNQIFPETELETGRRFNHQKLEKSANAYSIGEKRVIQGREIITNVGWIWTQKTFDERLAKNPRLIYWTGNNRPRYKLYADEYEGKLLPNLWADIPALSSNSGESLGYPTQKSEALLERIISASSNEGDVVLDVFCGCGTTVAVANRLRRRWIGMDITYQSIALILKRLKDSEGQAAVDNVVLHGVPQDIESVDALIHKKDDRVRKEFEKWAVLTYSNNRAVINEKKGADGGIDGIAYTRKSTTEVLPVIISVKSGKIGRKEMGELRGTIERENAAAGIMIMRHEPTKPMIIEAKSAGQFKPEHFPAFDRLQIVTVEEILSGARMNLPLVEAVTKQAQKARVDTQPNFLE